ncbi:MAG: PQQ-binding-like beta-propeller repeat protein [Candidatus Bathyarchaeia archaeon]
MKNNFAKMLSALMIVTALLGFAAVLPTFAVNPEPNAYVIVDPALSSFPPPVFVVGSTFNVNVSLVNITNVAGVRFHFTWDPTLLSVTNMTEILFQTKTPSAHWGNIWNLSFAYNNTAGYADYAQAWSDSGTAQADGYAPLNVTTATDPPEGKLAAATFTFQVLKVPTMAEGNLTCVFHLTTVKIGDIDGNKLIDTPSNTGNPPVDGTYILAPALSASIWPSSATLGVGQSQWFTSSVSRGTSPYTYQWYLNGSAVQDATSSSWTFTPTSAGAYTVYMEVSDSVGAQATSNTATVIVNGQLPVGWWPMFHRDLTHTGYSTSTAPTTNQLLWNYTTGNSVLSSPAVAGGVVYVGSGPLFGGGNVYALNATTGSQVWNYTTGGAVTSSPAVADGMVYVGSWDYKIYCLDAMTGAQVWNYTTGGLVFSSPVVVGGVVYVGSVDGKVYALNASTGAFIWSCTTGDLVTSSPAVAGGVVYVGSTDHMVYALNATTGAFIWSYTTGNSVNSSPAVAGGVVYVGSYDHMVYALNATTGAQVWSCGTGWAVSSSPAVAGGVVYVGSYDNDVYALNATTGAFVWGYATGNEVFSSPAVAGGVVYVGSLDGKVYAFGVHDVAVTNVASSKTVVYQGYSVTINVTVANQGSYTETFNVTTYANATIIGSENVTLPAGSSTTVTFTWDTTGFAYGNYTLSAYAWPVLGEISIADNNFIGGTVKVTILGDINGDGTVDIYDAIIQSGHFNQHYP